MCRGQNEPGGPVRCSHHMGEALKATQSKYAGTVHDLTRLKQSLEQDREYAAKFEDHAQNTESGRQNIKIQEIEDIEASIKSTESLVHKLEQREATWKQKVKQAQANFDSTRGGLSKLAEEHNLANKRLKNLIANEEEELASLRQQNPDLNNEEIQNLYQQKLDKEEDTKKRLRKRISVAEQRLDAERAWRIKKSGEDEPEIDTVSDELVEDEEVIERQTTLEEEENASELVGEEEEDKEPAYKAIDNHEDSEDLPSGDDSDILLNQEMNEEFDKIIDELDLSGISVDYGDDVDPDTGVAYNKKEIEVFSRKMRREARARVRRQAMADGDTREILRSFLRTAAYRALRYNKSTKKLTRLIGISHFNSIVDKVDDLNAERQDKKLKNAKAKWREKRSRVAEEELATINDLKAKDEEKHAKQIERINHLKERGKLSDSEYSHYKNSYDRELKSNLSKLAYERNVISRMQIQWNEEEAIETENREKREAEVRQALIETERQRKEVNDYLNQTTA